MPMSEAYKFAVYSTIPRPHKTFYSSTPRGRIPRDQNTIQPKTNVDRGKPPILVVPDTMILFGILEANVISQ